MIIIIMVTVWSGSVLFLQRLFIHVQMFFPNLPALGNAEDSLGISAEGYVMKIKF